MCLFYAIEKKGVQKVSMCTISILQFIALGSPKLLFINKYQQNIFHINQSYVFISFSLSYHKVIISHTLNFKSKVYTTQ